MLALEENDFRKSTFATTIEGIWSDTENQYLLALTQDTEHKYGDFVGVLLSSNNPIWKKGEIKMEVRNTSVDTVYIGNYYISNKTKQGATITIEESSIMKINTRAPDGKPQTVVMVKIFPKVDTVNTHTTTAFSMGTAFAISEDVIVTNFHVVAGASSVQVQYADGTRATATLLAKDPSNDLAMLQLAKGSSLLQPLPVGDVRKVRDGEKVFTVGFPLPSELGVRAKVSEGIVNSVTGMGDDPRMYQISIPVQPGNSGGPLIDEKGRVVGVVTSGLNNKYLLLAKGVLSQNVNFAMKINYINNLIAILPNDLKLVVNAGDKSLNAEQVMEQVKGSIVLVISTVPEGQ
jgi:serine protease Do